VLARNDEIADYSLEQYRGTTGKGDGANAEFAREQAKLDVFQYVRASMTVAKPAPPADIRALVPVSQ
jgi:hypothetical protein